MNETREKETICFVTAFHRPGKGDFHAQVMDGALGHLFNDLYDILIPTHPYYFHFFIHNFDQGLRKQVSPHTFHPPPLPPLFTYHEHFLVSFVSFRVFLARVASPDCLGLSCLLCHSV